MNDLVQPTLFDVIVYWKFPSLLRSISADGDGDECVLNVSMLSMSASVAVAVSVQLSWQHNSRDLKTLCQGGDHCNKITKIDIRFLLLNFLTVPLTYTRFDIFPHHLRKSEF